MLDIYIGLTSNLLERGRYTAISGVVAVHENVCVPMYDAYIRKVKALPTKMTSLIETTPNTT